MRRLKTIFACMLMAIFSVGQVWGGDVTWSWSASSGAFGTASPYNASLTGSTTPSTPADNTKAWTITRSSVVYTGFSSSCIQMGSKSGAETVTISSSAFSGTIKSVAIECSSYNGAHKVGITVGGTSYLASTTATPSWTTVTSKSGTGTSSGEIVITLAAGSRAVYVKSITVVYNNDDPSTPTVAADPEEVEVDAAAHASQSIALSYDNWGTENIDDVTPSLWNNATCTEAFNGGWISNVDVAAGYASVSFDIAANTGAARAAYLKLSVVGDNLSEAETVVAISQAEYVEPFDGLQLTFPEYNDDQVSAYTASWTATKSGQVWNLYGFNNYNNGWAYIKAGRKSASGNVAQPVDATIETQVTDHAVGDIVVTVDAVTAAQITSHKLYVADNSSFDGAIEIDGAPATIAAGDITYTVPVANRANDLYYKLEYATAGTAGSNGTLTISKITYAYATAAPQKESTGLAYAEADKNNLVKVGASFTAPTLINPNSLGGITYASSNDAVVEVNPSTGAIVEIKAAGKAVITASRAEDETYKVGSAYYTIYVAAQAGTAEDPLSEASAKALIDLGCEMTAHVAGAIFGTPSYNETYHNYSVTLTDGFQFFRLKDLGNADFTSGYLKAGDELVAVGPLAKHNTTYELAEGCYLTSYTEYTEPLVDISNTKETAYTVAQALALAVDPTSDLTKAVYIAGVVYDVKSFNSTNGTLDIYIKDEGVENKFEFYKCAGIYDESLTAFTAADDVQVGDEVIGYGVMKYYSGGSIWEFDNTATGDYLVELTRPEVAVSSVSLPATETVEVGSTVTLTATVLPDNATNKAITWTVESGDTYASVADGVVTGLVAGEAVIRAASTADPTKYAECTVTVTAADPTKHKVTFDAMVDQGESPLSKSNITFTCSSGVLNNGSEYRLYKNSTTTFACSAGNIIKIEFTGVSGNPVSGFGDPEVGTLVTEGYDGVWTGNAASVAFVASGAQVRATEIKVTYKEDNRAEAGLAWNPADDIEITVGDAFSAPALQNPNSIDASEISIESSNTSLATVTAGVVSLVADAIGTATITATFNGNDDYKPATVSYNITVNEAGLDNVTFDSSEDHAESGETTITKSGFTLSFTSGSMDGTQAEYRLYKSQTMTLSSSSYLIKKIEFTCTSGNPISGFADAEGLDKANNQWTGEANSVELTASNAQVRMTLLKVYYIEDTRATSDLAWSTDEVEITLGDAFTAANLVNPNSIDASAITIESDNTDLAVVNDGVVSLVENATGTAHISAIFAGNETYKPANVSYTIIVLDPTPTIYVNKLNVNFASVEVGEAVPAAQTVTVTLTNVASVTATLGGTNADAFSISPASLTESGDITISILANTDAAASYAATLTISDGEEGAQDKTVNLSFEVTEPVVEDDVTGTWTLVTDATPLAAGKKVIIAQYVEANGAINTMAAQSSNNRSVIASTVAGATLTPAVGTKVMTLANAGEGKFYLMTSAGEYLYNASTSGKSYLKTKAASEDASWTISVTAAGVATIASVENTNRINMRYNENGSNPALFNCYASGQNDIALYMLEEDTPEPPTPSYTEVRTGLEADHYYTLCYNKTMTAIKGASLWQFLNKDANFAYIVEAEAPYVAGTPYLIYAESDKLEAVVEEVASPVAGNNNGLYGTFVNMDADALSTAGATHMLKSNMIKAIGANNHLDAYRAYIKIGEIPGGAAPAPGRRVKAMPMQPQEATGLDNIFDINADGAQKLILNGQLIIIREGKMYDTTGRVVK